MDEPEGTPESFGLCYQCKDGLHGDDCVGACCECPCERTNGWERIDFAPTAYGVFDTEADSGSPPDAIFADEQHAKAWLAWHVLHDADRNYMHHAVIAIRGLSGLFWNRLDRPAQVVPRD